MIKEDCGSKNLLVKRWFGDNFTSIMPAAVIVVLVSIFQAINPFFLQYQGIISLIYAMSYFLIAACGLTFVIMMGSFDFSVVSVLKLSALLCVVYINEIGLWVVPLALLVSVLFGLINGLIFTKLKVPSFLTTLGISIVIEGIALYMSKGFLRIMENDVFRSLSITFIAGLPSIFYWAIGIVIISTLIAFITPFGRRIFAIGGNPVAAAHSGINVNRTRISVFMLSGFLSGLAGILYMAQLGRRVRVDRRRHDHTSFCQRRCRRNRVIGRRRRPAQDDTGRCDHYMDANRPADGWHRKGHTGRRFWHYRNYHEHRHDGQENDQNCEVALLPNKKCEGGDSRNETNGWSKKRQKE